MYGWREGIMLLITGVLITFVAAVAIVRGRAPGGGKVANLGGMSQQWLAEQRAARPN